MSLKNLAVDSFVTTMENGEEKTAKGGVWTLFICSWYTCRQVGCIAPTEPGD